MRKIIIQYQLDNNYYRSYENTNNNSLIIMDMVISVFMSYFRYWQLNNSN